jgi:hypothetical protein
MAINTKLQNIIDTKSAIGNAIVNKGGAITSSTPFYNYAAEIDNLATGGGGGTIDGFDETKLLAVDINMFSTGTLNSFQIVNGFLYITNASRISKHDLNDMSLQTNVTFTAGVSSLVVNNGFVFGVGAGTNTINKMHDSNLIVVGNSIAYGGGINNIAINNGFLYIGGATNQRIKKFNEDTLEFIGETIAFGGTVTDLAIKDGYIYVGGATTNTIKKYDENTLEFIGNTNSVFGATGALFINNGFLYAAGASGDFRTIKKFHLSNLTFESESINYGLINSLIAYNGFIYAGRNQSSFTIGKFYENNLTFVTNSTIYPAGITTLAIDNDFLYATSTGAGGNLFRKHYTKTPFTNNIDNNSYYLIPKEVV